MLLLLLACSSPNPDFQEEPEPSSENSTPTRARYDSPQLGDGFGSAIAIGTSVLIGAPNTPLGRVYQLSADDNMTLFFEEPSPGAAGSALAFQANHEALIGAPLFNDGVGRVYANGEALQEGGRVLGGRIVVRDNTVFITESHGLWENTEYRALENRVFAIEQWGELTVIGHALGDPALELGPQSLSREIPHDELGYAICAANFDDDAEDEIAIGAPGSGRVYILNPGDTLSDGILLEFGKGRFGHALACTDHFLVVGAPTYGDQLTGAAWCFQGTVSDWFLGEATYQGQPWEQLGSSMAMGSRTLVIGAPGNASTRGSVQKITW